MRWSLFLDDIRNPKTPSPHGGWIIARSFNDALIAIEKMGAPSYISFDHDLGENEPTGMDLAKWLVEQDMNRAVILPNDFRFFVHSANTVGAANIEGLLAQYLKVKQSKTVHGFKKQS